MWVASTLETMSIDLVLLFERIGTVTGLVVFLILIKLVILFGLALAFGHGRARAVRIAAVLSQCGEFGFVLFGAAKGVGLIPDLAFVIALLAISVSMALTPLMVKLGDMAAARLEAAPDADAGGGEGVPADVERHVIIAGYGRVGSVVASMLERAGIPYVAYDMSPARVAHAKRLGHEVHFGDLTKAEVLTSAGVGRSAAVVVTLQDIHDAERLASMQR